MIAVPESFVLPNARSPMPEPTAAPQTQESFSEVTACQMLVHDSTGDSMAGRLAMQAAMRAAMQAAIRMDVRSLGKHLLAVGLR